MHSKSLTYLYVSAMINSAQAVEDWSPHFKAPTPVGISLPQGLETKKLKLFKHMKFMFELFTVFCDFRRADEKSIPSRMEHPRLLHLRPDEKHSPLKMRKHILNSVLCPSAVASYSH